MLAPDRWKTTLVNLSGQALLARGRSGPGWRGTPGPWMVIMMAALASPKALCKLDSSFDQWMRGPRTKRVYSMYGASPWPFPQ